MPPQTTENRVDTLERRVTELEKLPERITAVESQIVQLRMEMREEFSATRRVLGERIDETNRHMRVLHEDVIRRLAVIQEGQSAPRRKRKHE